MASSASSGELIEAARELASLARNLSADIDRDRRLPDLLAEQLKEAGLFRMLLGQEFGGLEADPITATQVVEIISESNASAGWVVMILASTSYWASAMLPDAAAQEVFLSGPEISMAGTLVPMGKAVKSEGGWLLSGRWPFGSGCLHADWMASGGVLSEAGEPVVDDSGAPMVRLFLTPVSDCRILDTWDTTGLRGTGSHDYTIDEVFVPDRFVIPHPLMASPVRPERHYAYPAVAVPMMTAVSLGAARAAVDGLKFLLAEKLDRRSARPVSDDPEKQADLAVAEALVGSARAYLFERFQDVWDTLGRGQPPSTTSRGRFRIACTHAVKSSVEAVERVYAAGGASSIYRSSELERYFRDVHTAAAHAFMRSATMADGGKLLLGTEPAVRIF